MREMMHVKSLDFIVIGASKSGTTTLFNYLRHHPQIYIPPDKEVPFFSRDDWFDRGWASFVGEFFARAPIDSLWGTVTPQYMEDGIRAPKRIFKLMPQVKLVAILRHPVDRAFSAYRMRVLKKRERRSFEKVLFEQLKPENLSKARMLPWHSATTTDTYLVTSEYGRMLSSFTSYFPLEQLLVLFTDDLEQRPQFVLDSIFEFIGLEPGFSPSNLGKRYYVGGTRKRLPWLIPSVQKLLPLKWFWKALPRDRRRAILFWFNTQMNVIAESSPKLELQSRHKLVEFYQPDVLKLQTLIEQNVPWQEFHTESKESGC